MTSEGMTTIIQRLQLGSPSSGSSRTLRPRTSSCTLQVFEEKRTMSGLSSRLSFWLCTALLALSAGWGIGVPAGRVVAQTATDNGIDKAIVDALKWRSVGPLRGGRSIATSGVKGRPKEGYFGAVGGGLWKT